MYYTAAQVEQIRRDAHDRLIASSILAACFGFIVGYVFRTVSFIVGGL